MEQKKQYLVAGVVTAAVVWLLYQYAVVRYGVVGLSSLNKSLSVSTLIFLGWILLLGPLSRLFSLFDGFLKYRKELGVLSFVTGATHVYLSMFPLARRGPFGFYLSQPWSAYVGLAALGIMLVLFLFSFGIFSRTLKPAIWWKMQNWGVRIAFAAVALHMIILKYAGWETWFESQGVGMPGMQTLPPMALLAAIFAAFVLVVRMSEFLGMRAARPVIQISFLVFLGSIVWLFAF